MCGWVRWKIELLKRWRRAAEIFAEAVREIEPRAKVYVFGGAAEGRLTVLSDLDVLVVVDKELSDEEKRDLVAEAMARAERRGLPWYYPIEVHVADRREAQSYFKHAKRMIEL